MRKDALARAVSHAVRRPGRGAKAVWARWFRLRPLVPDAAFQDAGDHFPAHWRRFPEAWSADVSHDEGRRATLRTAVDALPGTWREVLLRHDAAGQSDEQVAHALGLTAEQERDLLAQSRAAVRDALDRPAAEGSR